MLVKVDSIWWWAVVIKFWWGSEQLQHGAGEGWHLGIMGVVSDRTIKDQGLSSSSSSSSTSCVTIFRPHLSQRSTTWLTKCHLRLANSHSFSLSKKNMGPQDRILAPLLAIRSQFLSRKWFPVFETAKVLYFQRHTRDKFDLNWVIQGGGGGKGRSETRSWWGRHLTIVGRVEVNGRQSFFTTGAGRRHGS